MDAIPHPNRPDAEALLRETGWLHAFARQLVRDASAADDVVQETLLSAYRTKNGPAMDSAPTLRAWLKHVAQRHAWMSHRASTRRIDREARVAKPESSEPPALDALERVDLQRRLAEAIQALPSPDREIVALRHVEGLPPREIAARLSLTPTATSTRLSRAMQRLRADLERDDPGLERLTAFAGLAVLGNASLRTATGAHAVAGSSSTAGTFVGVLLMKKLIAWSAIVLIAAWCVVALTGRDTDARDVAQGADVAAHRLGPIADGPPSAPSEAPSDGIATSVERVAVSMPAAPEADEPELAPGPTAGAIEVRVVEAGSNLPAPTVGLQLVRFGGSNFWNDVMNATTDDRGIARFEGLRPGPVTVYSQRPSGTGDFRAEGAVVALDETVKLAFQVDPEATIRGRVVDDLHRPVAGATLWLGEGNGGHMETHMVARSGADGSFVIRYADPMQEVCARAEGHADSRMVMPGLLGPDGGVEGVTLVVDRAHGSVHGIVLDHHGQPAVDALIVVGNALGRTIDPDGVPTWTAPPRILRSGNDGRFACSGLAPGTTSLQARIPGTNVANATAEIQVGTNVEVTLQLQPAGNVHGVVTHADGQPCTGARISLVTAGDSLLTRSEAVSDENGAFELNGVPGTSIELHVEDTQTRASVLARVDARPNETVQCNPRLPAVLQISGQLILANGESALDWIVQGRANGRESESMGRRFTRTDADGRFELTPCLDHPYAVTVRPPGHYTADPAHSVLDVRPGGTDLIVNVPVHAIPSASVRGTIVDAEGSPLIGEVELVSRPTGYIRRDVETTATGVFELRHLPPGGYSLTISVEGRESKVVELHRVLEAEEHRDVGAIAL